MRYLIIVNFLVALVGCGHGNDIDPTLQPYVDSFVAAGNITIVAPIKVQFGDILNQNSAGLCETSIGVPTITIDKSTWASLFDVDLQRQLIVWHELGHCVLGRSHNNAVDGDGLPVSIMTTQSSRLEAFTKHPAALIEELFHPAN